MQLPFDISRGFRRSLTSEKALSEANETRYCETCFGLAHEVGYAYIRVIVQVLRFKQHVTKVQESIEEYNMPKPPMCANQLTVVSSYMQPH